MRTVPRIIVVVGILLGLSLRVQPVLAVTAAEWRIRADHAAMSGHYDVAAEAYRHEADIYDRMHDHNGALAERVKAARWSTKIGVYDRENVSPGHPSPPYFGRKYEPEYGCYVSAYVEGDPSLDKPADSDSYSESRPDVLGDLIHKHLAVVWDYSEYGSRFPINWAHHLVDSGIAPEIAWEPNRGLQQVQDDTYLERFAHDAAACGGPIFLRFASEMNGDWTAYHGNAALYRSKFRLVHDVMARIAPNVAMIWCVNVVPQENMQAYYPGDAYVDWVGVNMYSVLHHDNNPSRSAVFEHPADMLDYVISHFGKYRPVAICEYGASHRERLNIAEDQSDVASVKYAELLNSLPRSYPDVKMIGFYDADNLTGKYVRAERKLNDYSLSDSDPVLRAVRAGLNDHYFLSEVKDPPAHVDTVFIPLPATVAAGHSLDLSLRVQTYVLRPNVRLQFDNQSVLSSSTPCQYDAKVDGSRVTPGAHMVTVSVSDAHGSLIADRTFHLRAVQNP